MNYSGGTTYGNVTIHRAHPNSKDPSVSTRGHESAIQSGTLNTQAEIDAFIAKNGPEFLAAGARTVVIHDYEQDSKVILSARDSRGYYGDCYINRRNDKSAEEFRAEYAAYVAQHAAAYRARR